MLNKSKVLVRLGTMMMAFSFAVVPLNGCVWFLGEPKLPNKLQKQK